MAEETTTGVESVPAAGEQVSEELDFEKILFGDDDNSGETEEEEQNAAGSEETEQGEGEEEKEQTEEPEKPDLPTEDASIAFAKKWEANKAKVKDELRAEIMEEIKQQTQTTTQQQSQGAPKYREMTEEQIQKLADDFETSPAVAKVLYAQQQAQNRLQEQLRQQTQRQKEQEEYIEAQRLANKLKQENQSLPDWDNKKLHNYRMEHYKKYGSVLPWGEAYKMAIADAVTTGNLDRQVQQETIKKIQKREETNVGLQKPSTPKLGVEDLTDEQFAKLKDEVMLGKYKRS